MANTTNFGWETPDDTDLVKDGAAAMRTLGNSIDASFVDLKGGTTGQILSKASNTDLDYTWINNDQGDITEVTAGVGISGGGTSGAVTITNSMATAIDAKGDLVAGTGADTFSRLAVGANNTVLTADSTTATGLKWAALTAGSNFSLINSAALTGAQTITISSISGKNKLLIIIDNGSSASASTDFLIRLNSDSGANYYYWGLNWQINGTYSANDYITFRQSGDSRFRAGTFGANQALNASGSMYIDGANTSGLKYINYTGGGGGNATNPGQFLYAYQGYYNSASTISSISVISNVGNFDNGTLYVYGSDN